MIANTVYQIVSTKAKAKQVVGRLKRRSLLAFTVYRGRGENEVRLVIPTGQTPEQALKTLRSAM